MDTNKVTRFFYGIKKKGIKYAPEMLLIGGIAGFGVAMWKMRKAAKKEDKIYISHQERINAIHDKVVKASEKEIVYTEEEQKKETVAAYASTVMDYVKLYAAPVGIAVGSVGLVLASNKIRKDRYLGLVAAYTTLSNSFTRYQKNVIAEYGEEVNRRLKNGVKKYGTINTNEAGEDVAGEIDVMDDAKEFNGEYSCYTKVFDSTNPNWSPNNETNRTFLIQNETWCNKLLAAQGYLFLNDVYRGLGFPKTKAGQVVGWLYHEDLGPHQVDFGMFNLTNPSSVDFVNGMSPSTILDFNVEGPIIDRVELNKF